MFDFMASIISKAWGKPLQMKCLCQAEISIQLRQMGDNFAKLNERIGLSFMNKLQINSDNLCSTFESFAKNLIADGMNWGRVAVVFHYARSLSKRAASIAASRSFDSFVQRIIREYFIPWMLQKGGWIQLAVFLFLSSLLNASPGARTRLKHGVGTTVKVTKLILWVCGDVETNPGPGNSRSEILRKFRKSQQSSILIILYKHFDSLSIPKSMYKETPNWWPSDTPFVNITNHKKDDESIVCFEKSIELLQNAGLSQDWTSILEFYNDLFNKCGDNVHLDLCKDNLLEWMDRKKIQKSMQIVDTKSFMDDLRIKLKVLEDLVNQGEIIPDDVANKISAVNMTITGSKRKRKCGSGQSFDISNSPKRRKSKYVDGTMHASTGDLPMVHHIAYAPQCIETIPSTACHIDKDSLSAENTQSNETSVESQGINGNATFAHNIETLNDRTQENCITNGIEDQTTRVKNESISDNETSLLELPSDLLNIILKENEKNDIIENFDLDLLELSDEEFCYDFMK